MASKIEMPDLKKNAWEQNSLILKSSDCPLEENEQIINLLAAALENPVKQNEENTEQKEADRAICAASAVHQADQTCRRLISQAMKEARAKNILPSELKSLAEELNKLKAEFLEDLRQGNHLKPGSVIATPMPPIIHTPRINVVPMPPSAPPIMSPRPPPMIVPTAFVPAPPVAPVPSPAPMPPVHPPPPMEDEPVSKKLKSEDSLIPEEEFLRRNKGPVTVKVQVPNMQDKTEWKLNGQVLVFTLPLSDQVSVIKVKIHEATGMPAGKQKLQYEGIFIKDSNSLAYYNMTSGSLIHLALKERGGRKK